MRRLVVRKFWGAYRRAVRPLVRRYAAHHSRRRTPLRICRIPGRGCRMWLPLALGKTVAQRRFGVFEPWTFAALDALVRPGMTIVELGACYGEFTIHLSRLAGPRGRVYAFEAMPGFFEILTKNIALNRLENVEAHHVAVGDREGEVQLDSGFTNTYGSLARVSGFAYAAATAADSADAASVPVPCIVLSRFLRDRSIRPDLVFMDIEGCEIQVLADLTPLLEAADAPAVYLELHPQFYGRENERRVEQLFEQRGYVVKRIGLHLTCLPPAQAAAHPAAVGAP